MTLTQTMSNPWLADCELLQCVSCGGQLEPASDDALTCAACARHYLIRDGVLAPNPSVACPRFTRSSSRA